MDRASSWDNDDTGTIFVVSAPSGGGKTTLVNRLMQHTDYIARVVTHTTRKPRQGEFHGEHYYFVSENDFKTLVENKGFFEFAEVFGNYYGTSKQAVFDTIKKGKDVVLVIDWQGATAIKRILPQAILIFIMPPSLQVLKNRLDHRNLDSKEIVERRMQDAISQMRHYDQFDYMIINDDFDIALSELKSIFQANRLQMRYQIKKEAALLTTLFKDTSFF